jgi:hypothetical protein
MRFAPVQRATFAGKLRAVAPNVIPDVTPDTNDTSTISQRTRFQIAMVLAMAADALQLIALPLFVEGAESPADDILDLGIGVAMVALLGWHWEFLPSFVAKLVPGVDLAPLWTLSVANVYRKSKRTLVTPTDEDRPRS